MRTPPYLQKGDVIGIVAPAGFMPVEKMQACIEALDGWGYTVRMGSTTHSESATYFSGTDDERLADLQGMMDDPEVKAILCARGGYGLSRIVDRLNFKRFSRSPKWVIGFSDVTVLHSHLNRIHRIACLHAPMAAAFNAGNNQYLQSLVGALEGQKSEYGCEPHPYNRGGEAVGELVGGNLCLLAHLVGSESEIKTKNKILFLEDVGEYLYNVDRMLIQLKRAGKLNRLAGLVIGGFTDGKDTERPFGQTVYEIIRDAVKEFSYPVCFGFPVSHNKENYALKVGLKHRLIVLPDAATLSEEP